MVMKNYCSLEMAKAMATSVTCHPGFSNEVETVVYCRYLAQY